MIWTNVTRVYTVVVTSGSESVSASVTVTVFPRLYVTVTANPYTILPGGSSQLNAQATGGTGSYTYSWTSSPAGFTSNLQNPVVSPMITTTYTVTVVSGTQSRTRSVTVTVAGGGGLRVRAWAKPSHIERGDRSHLYCRASGGSGNYTYSWTSNPAGFTSNQQNPYVKPYVTTKYTVLVTSGNKTGTASVTVYVEDDDDDDGSLANSLEPANESLGEIPWNQELTPKITKVESVNPVEMVASPNPTPGLFKLLVRGEITGTAAVTILDIRGKIVRKEMVAGSELHNRSFDLSTYPKGLYIISIQSENLQKTIKIVLQ